MRRPDEHRKNARTRTLQELLDALRADAQDRTELERQLAMWLADTIPEAHLGRVTSLLSEEEMRRRSDRYDELLEAACNAYEGGDVLDARASAERACALDPLRWEGHHLLAQLLHRSGDPRAAELHEAMAFHLGAEDASDR